MYPHIYTYIYIYTHVNIYANFFSLFSLYAYNVQYKNSVMLPTESFFNKPLYTAAHFALLFSLALTLHSSSSSPSLRSLVVTHVIPIYRKHPLGLNCKFAISSLGAGCPSRFRTFPGPLFFNINLFVFLID